MIGEGAYGVVYKSQIPHHVIKVFKCANNVQEHGVGRDAVREIAILRGLNANWCAFVPLMVTGNLFETGMLMPEANKGSLHQFMISNKANLSESVYFTVACTLAKQIFRAVAHIHSRGIIHRDIKPQNIIVSHNDDGIQARLCDFGNAIVHTNVDAMRMSKPGVNWVVSTLWYRTPETAFHIDTIPTTAMDMWGVAMIMCELFRFVDNPVFKCLQRENNDHLVSCIVSMLGIPTKKNDLMPSYFMASKHDRRKHLHVLPAYTVSHPVTKYWTTCDQTQKIVNRAAKIIMNTLLLEPTRRKSAYWCYAQMTGTMLQIDTTTMMDNEKLLPTPSITKADRQSAGHIIGETCLMSNGFKNRRTYHAAVRLFDSLPVTIIDHIPTVCAAAISIASKVCDEVGVSANWASILQGYARVHPDQPALGLAKYLEISTANVIRKEAQILETLKWNVWKPTPIDIVRPSTISESVYTAVLDLIVANISTSTFSSVDIATVTHYICTQIVRSHETPQKLSPSCSVFYNDIINTMIQVDTCMPLHNHYGGTHVFFNLTPI